MKVKRYLICVLLAAALVPGLGSARAEGEATVSVLPAAAEVDLVAGQTVEIEMYVTNGVDINAFEVRLTYDPQVVTLLCPYGGSHPCWKNGGFLDDDLLVPFELIQSGIFHVAFAQTTQPNVSGEGSLIKLTFQGSAIGISAIDIKLAKFANRVGDETYPLTEDGSLQVFPQRFNLAGTVSRQGQSKTGGIPVRLGVGQTKGYGPYEIFSQDGGKLNLPFGKVVGDTYTFTTNQPGYLNPQKNLTLSADLTLPPLRLLAGDVTGDQAVTTADLDAIRAAFGSSGLGLAADLNGDGIVDLRDLALAGGNFGLTATEAYADWLE